MDTPDYDLIICGAGPAGSALALLLAETWPEPRRIALIDQRPAGMAQHADESARLRDEPNAVPTDARQIAISHGSKMTLKRLGAWSEASATPIERIHVSHRGHFGRTVIDHADYQIPALGYVIAYRDLLAQFDAARTRQPFTMLSAARATAIEQDADGVTVTLDDGRVLRGRHAVHAEGGLFNAQAARPLHRDYGQHAITTVVRAALPQAGVAWERFTEEGPIALLPLNTAQGPRYSLVWCGHAGNTAQRLALPDDAFLEALWRAFGDRLGRFLEVGPRQSFELGLNAVDQPVAGRVFAIGNAAQTLHPVAGQGMNLALRDACMLAAALREHGNDAAACGQAYARSRRLDRKATIQLTDWLPRIFASRLAPVIALRGPALALLDIVPPTRHWLARQMMNGQR